ncbi:MAG TPA: DEAD/DEAH box helicase [Anaerolineaceae bacterium]|nr:DEAD/DEAH box helicase [Anaerolineaceae bacterium]
MKNTFGYDTFRPLQKEVIENILAHRDTLAIMPTGGGKSLCYQIPALLLDGLTVVVSPLIALMKDQVEQLRASGVPALFLNSTLSPQAYQENMGYIRRGKVKLLYLAPETLLTPRIFALLDSVYVFVGQAFNAGESIASLMRRHQLMADTILDYLARYVAAGNKLRRSDDLNAMASASPDDQQAVFNAFDRLGTLLLKPVFDELDGRIDYNELKILRLIYLTVRE